MTNLILFGTEGCHLCDDAESLLYAANIKFDKRDIINDELAQQRYAVRIPVLVHQATALELGWPFTAEQLRAFIATLAV